MAAKLILFDQYQVFYYSASNQPEEAAYINCFDSKKAQVGCLKFLYEGIPMRPNVMVAGAGAVMHYPLSRFDHVIGLLEHAKAGAQSMVISFDEANKIFALCNSLYVPIGDK